MTQNKNEILSYWRRFKECEPLISSNLVDLAWATCQHESLKNSLGTEQFRALAIKLEEHHIELGVPESANDADYLHWAVVIGFHELGQSVRRE